jgi:tRNA threonylcarbamoyladenosine biosynthesis protein TsaB
MVVLALDTTVRSGSVAVLRGADVIVERVGDAAVPHGQRLPGDALAALHEAGMTVADVELYGVAAGPGAFTGLRVGIATVQGLAFAHRRPVAAISALDALANAALSHPRTGASTLIAPWMDAARGEVFSAIFELAEDAEVRLIAVEGPSVASPDATLARWEALVDARRVIFVGEGALRYRDRITASLGERADVVPVAPPIASIVGRLAAGRAAAGDVGPPHAVRPLYVRRPDAELAREERKGAAPSGGRTAPGG